MIADENDYSIFLAGDNAGFEQLVIRYKNGLLVIITPMWSYAETYAKENNITYQNEY